jgi:hypothetical protein
MLSPPSGSLAAVIFPSLTVIVTWTGPYWVLTVRPLKVPDGFGAGGAAVWVGGAWVAGVLAVAVFVLVAFGVADFVADGLVAGGFIVGAGAPDGEVADSVGMIGVLSAVTVGACVLYENSAASPATVPPRARTARRI